MAKKRKYQPAPAAPPGPPLPATVEEAVAFLQARTAPEVAAEIRAAPLDDLILFHRDIGMQVRNLLGLWGRNPALIDSLPERERWPDNAGMYIMEAWWRAMQDAEPGAAADPPKAASQLSWVVQRRRASAVWTLDREFDQPIRHMDLNQSGGSFVANLTLRVGPDLDEPGVSFASAVAEPDAAYYAPYVEEGVRAFVSRRASEGRAVGHLRVTLTAITIHPVDAKTHRFAQAADMAMSQAFDAAGVEL